MEVWTACLDGVWVAALKRMQYQYGGFVPLLGGCHNLADITLAKHTIYMDLSILIARYCRYVLTSYAICYQSPPPNCAFPPLSCPPRHRFNNLYICAPDKSGPSLLLVRHLLALLLQLLYRLRRALTRLAAVRLDDALAVTGQLVVPLALAFLLLPDLLVLDALGFFGAVFVVW